MYILWRNSKKYKYSVVFLPKYSRPDYAPESSSDESEEEFIVKRTKQKADLKEEEEKQEEEINDPRLRRLQVIQLW